MSSFAPVFLAKHYGTESTQESHLTTPNATILTLPLSQKTLSWLGDFDRDLAIEVEFPKFDGPLSDSDRSLRPNPCCPYTRLYGIAGGGRLPVASDEVDECRYR